MQHRGVTASASGSGSESERAAASGSASGGESATVALVVVVVVAVADDAAEVRYTDEKEEKSSAECGVRAVAMWWSVRETMMR